MLEDILRSEAIDYQQGYAKIVEDLHPRFQQIQFDAMRGGHLGNGRYGGKVLRAAQVACQALIELGVNLRTSNSERFPDLLNDLHLGTWAERFNFGFYYFHAELKKRLSGYDKRFDHAHVLKQRFELNV